MGPNPVSQVKLPSMVRKAQPILTITQTRAILELMQNPDRDIALFLLMTGMTIVETCELRWRNVNLSNFPLYIGGELMPARSIAVKRGWNRLGLDDVQPRRDRTIELKAPFISHLRELHNRRVAAGKNDFVLVSETGDQIPSESIGIERLKPIRRKLGIPWLSWQALRRAGEELLAEYRTQLGDRVMEGISEADGHSTNHSGPIGWIGDEDQPGPATNLPPNTPLSMLMRRKKCDNG